MALRKAAPDDGSLHGRPKFQSQQVSFSRQDIAAAHSLLTEIQALLEEYGPTWYTEELNEKLASVLKKFEEEL